MAKSIPLFTSTLLPLPDLQDDEAVLAYGAAFVAWRDDRQSWNADAITVYENVNPEHAAVMSRFAALKD